MKILQPTSDILNDDAALFQEKPNNQWSCMIVYCRKKKFRREAVSLGNALMQKIIFQLAFDGKKAIVKWFSVVAISNNENFFLV